MTLSLIAWIIEEQWCAVLRETDKERERGTKERKGHIPLSATHSVSVQIINTYILLLLYIVRACVHRKVRAWP